MERVVGLRRAMCAGLYGALAEAAGNSGVGDRRREAESGDVPDEHRAGIQGGEARKELFERGREGVVAVRCIPQERGVDHGLRRIEGEPEGGEEVGRAGEQDIVDGVERVEREEARDERTQRRIGGRGGRLICSLREKGDGHGKRKRTANAVAGHGERSGECYSYSSCFVCSQK